MKHRNPWDKALLSKHRELLKQYKKVCSNKKFNFWKKEVSKLDELDNSDFWENWKNLGEEKTYPSEIPGVNGSKWEGYFQKLFQKQNGSPSAPNNSNAINEELNKIFTMSELEKAILKLKNNKAVGPDRISNEFIKNATPEIKEIILRFFNLNLKYGITADKLCEDFITLIYKEGKKDDPENYRGICIANSLLKMLCSIME